MTAFSVLSYFSIRPRDCRTRSREVIFFSCIARCISGIVASTTVKWQF